MDGDFRTSFVREPAALRRHPSLVLNADYRPLSYYPLSLWPWQEAVKAVWLDRVRIVAEYEETVHSPSTEIRIPSVVVLKEFVKPRKRVAFTRFNLFLRDEFTCQYCGATGDLTFDHVVPRAAGGVTSWENVVAACAKCNLRKGSKSLRQSGMRLRTPPPAAGRGGAAQPRAQVPAQPPARKLDGFPLLGRRAGGVSRRALGPGSDMLWPARGGARW